MKDYSKMSDCIIFSGYRNKDGYGRMTYMGKVRQAHRVAYCKSAGVDIEDISGFVVMHSCDNPSCMNPDHLSLGTQIDNISDRCKKGRTSRNYNNKNQAKLTVDNVIEIRGRYKPRCSVDGCRAMAVEFGVSAAAISLVVSGKNWSK